MKIPIEISARHCHLSQKDLEALFGKGYELKKLRQLTQPSDFACQETVAIKSNSHILENIRIVGPVREQTQVEISKTDAIFLKIDAPLRLSGDLKGSGAIKIIGPAGEINLLEGLIIPQRHLHCATDEVKKLKLENGSVVSIKIPARNAAPACKAVATAGRHSVAGGPARNAAHSAAGGEGERGVIFNNVKVRVRDDYKLCLHLDTDEGNACGINKVGEGLLIP